MVGIVDIMKENQVIGRFSVRGLISNEFLEWPWDADIPPDLEIIRVLTDKSACWVQRKSGFAKQFNSWMFIECNQLMLQEPGAVQVHQFILESFAV